MDNSKLSKAKCFIKAFGLWNAIRIHWYIDKICKVIRK